MKHSSNVSKKTRLCFTCGSPRHLQSQCPQYTSTRAPANQNLSKNQKHCSYDSTPYHSKAPNPPNDALKNVGFKPPGSYQTQRKYQFETDFESHFLVPARVRYVHRDLVSAVNDFHYAMMNDIDRNDFYYNMLKKAIKPGISTVLEIGPGSGLLSMIAATLGAKWILAVEGSRDLAELARHNVAVNGFEDRVTIMHMMSTELRHHHMPNNELATILVSELFGTLLLGESALDYIAQVRAQPGILAKDCVILPRRGIQYAVPVSCPSLEILSKAYPYRGLHLEHMNALRDTSSCVFSKKYGFRLNSVPYKELSDPIEILKVDFAQDQQVAPLHDTQTVRMKQEGTVHAMILFWKACDDLTGAAISTDAKDTIDNFARDMQWGQAIQLLDALDCDPVRVENRCERPQDLVVKQGDEMTLVTRVSRDGVILQFSLFPAIEKV